MKIGDILEFARKICFFFVKNEKLNYTPKKKKAKQGSFSQINAIVHEPCRYIISNNDLQMNLK